MRKFSASIIIAVISIAMSVVARQNGSMQSMLGSVIQTSTEIPSRGLAPKTENGIGRADVRVYDENGRPLEGIYVHLTSHRSDGFSCESWNRTDANGLANLPPIHMGILTFDVNKRDDINKITNKSYKKKRVEYMASDLNRVIRITLLKK